MSRQVHPEETGIYTHHGAKAVPSASDSTESNARGVVSSTPVKDLYARILSDNPALLTFLTISAEYYQLHCITR
jgi:hypothetical protein